MEYWIARTLPAEEEVDDAELTRLLHEVESDRVERKASITDKSGILQAICAFANDLPHHRQPGIVFVGAHDDGSCSHLDIDDELLKTLASMRSDGKIHPFPSLSVQKRQLSGCEMAVVIVQPSDSPPVRLDGRTWIRVGPRRGVATVEEERRLTEKRRFKDQPFDLRPVTSASLDDLDLDLFQRQYLPSAVAPDILGQNERSLEHQLRALRFTAAEPPYHPTVLGMLVIGRDPRGFLPGAYAQFLRLTGCELTDPIRDQKEVSGPLTEMLQRLEETLTINISTASDILAQPVELRTPDYPLAALQQLVRNAVLHRNYESTNAPVRVYWFEDRIEILNPGGPFGQVNRENFGRPGIADYRNPHLAEAMKNLGFVQRFGVGIQLARKEMQRNGNPPLEFVVEDSYVLATLRRRM
jgi:ATP-dependent DNA helicase RecG